MRKIILSVATITVFAMTSCKNDVKKETESVKTEISKEVSTITFGVRGNCGMCKKTIEKAANNVEGVSSATWDVVKKKIEVSFDDSKIDVMTIHKAIAASGYDTEKLLGNEDSYHNLPGCCQYDHEMAMNQSVEATN